MKYYKKHKPSGFPLRAWLPCLLLLVMSIACKEKSASGQATGSSLKAFQDTLVSTKQLQVTLTPQAHEQVSGWLAFGAAQDAVGDLEQKTILEIMASANSLEQIMESLNTTIPDTLKSNAVQARTNVLLTLSRVLEQRSVKKQRNPEEITAVANQLITSFENLKIQLNELFLKSPGVFDLEPERDPKEAYDPIPSG